MNLKTNSRRFYIILLFLTCLISCGTNDDGPAPAQNTIAEIIADSPEFSILQAALVRTGLDASLQTSGLLTLFAPTDTAFNIFLVNANFASVDDVPVPVLEQLLLNHVLGARVDESILRALGRNYTETLAEGPAANTNLALYFDALGTNILLNGKAKIIDADISATNGLIHVVDAVLDFPTLATFVQSNIAFSKLTQALTTATPATNFIAMLSGSTTYTLFAPADVAFDALLDTDPSWNSVNDIDEDLLTAILQHHIISGNVRSSDISNNETVTTLEGDDIIFSTNNAVIDITDGEGNMGKTVVVANIQAINGVLHALDEVLIPDTSN